MTEKNEAPHVEDVTPIPVGGQTVESTAMTDPSKLTTAFDALLKQMQQMGAEVVDFENTEATEKIYPIFKGEEGRKYRLGFPVPRFITVKHHFMGRKFQCTGGICCQKLGEPKRTFATPIVLYETRSNGDLITPVTYKIQCLSCNDDRANFIQQTHKDFNLHKFDLLFTCEDGQYQTGQFAPKPQAIWTLDPDVMQDVMKQVAHFLPTTAERVAAKLTEDKILELIRSGGKPGQGGRPVAPDVAPSSDVGGVPDFTALFKRK